MSTDTPAAAPITAEREACEQSFRASKYMQVVYAPESRPYLDGWLARAALSAPVAAQPAVSGVDAQWVEIAMKLADSYACTRAATPFAGQADIDAARENLRTHLSTALTGAAKDVK